MTGPVLDHVIIATADLDEAARTLGNAIGRAPSWHGRHPTYGTANVLFRLDNAYLELLAPDSESPRDSAWSGSLGRFLNERGEGLFSVALGVPDVLAAAEAARARGLLVDEPAEGEGIDLRSGAVRRWCNARIPPEVTRGTRVFYIEHRSPPDALPPAPFLTDMEGAICSIAAVQIQSADPERAQHMWKEQFGLKETAASGGRSYDLSNASLHLQPPPEALLHPELVEGRGVAPLAAGSPDRWGALICRAPDLVAVRRRLRETGIEHKDAEHDGSDAVRLVACGAPLLLLETA